MNRVGIAEARRLLENPSPASQPRLMLAAAALAATSAVLMAGVMVLGAGVRFEEPVPVDGSAAQRVG